MQRDISVDSSGGAALHRDVIDVYGHAGDNGMNNKNCHGVENNNCENGYGEDEYVGALTTTEDDGIRRKKKRFRGPKQWKKEWVQTYPWATVRVVRGKGCRYCPVCEAHGSTATRNAFQTEGSTNYKPTALATHDDSSAQKNALQTQQFWISAEQVATAALSSVTKHLAPKKSSIGKESSIHSICVLSRIVNIVTHTSDSTKLDLR